MMTVRRSTRVRRTVPSRRRTTQPATDWPSAWSGTGAGTASVTTDTRATALRHVSVRHHYFTLKPNESNITRNRRYMRKIP